MSNAMERRRELGAETYLPYVRHSGETTIVLKDGSLMSMVALDGVAFETADPVDINAAHRALNLLYRNIADERLALWSHVFRLRSTEYPEGSFSNRFVAGLDAKYKERLVASELYHNELYLSVVWMPGAGAAEKAGALLGRLSRAQISGAEVDAGGLKALKEKTLDLVQGLGRYGARLLGFRIEDGFVFSEPCEVLHRLVGGRREKIALTDGPIHSAIYSDRVVIGRETVEVRYEAETRFAGMFGFKEYPATTRPGMLDVVLSAPFECVLTQSFRFFSKAVAKSVMSRKQNQMLSSGDRALSQIGELDAGLDDLESNRFVMGEHHVSLAVFAASPKELIDTMGQARGRVTSGGAVVAREDLGLEAAWWGQLPGNLKFRPRSGAITSRNFAALSPFHSYPVGRCGGNPWGPAVAMLKTSSGAPYYFNFHAPDSGLGNTFVCGPSGSGKTVILNFMLAQLQKHDPWMVFFDKDRGAELFVRAAGGTYLSLRNGVPTGCAPLKGLDTSPGSIGFLEGWIGQLADAGRPLTAAERSEIAKAVRGVAALPIEQRTFEALRAHMDQTQADGVAARLERWQRGQPLGWVFDNEEDAIGLGAKFLGYDMTDFLDNRELRTPLMAYLFHRVEKPIDGRRIVICIDEFWKALADEGFRDLAQNKLKTIRKQNGLMLFATQSPRDAMLSPIAHTIIEQCPTQVFMPNSRGDRKDYVEGFKLTEREFDLVTRELSPDQRRFLVKQGASSVVAELNLAGFDDELAILSGTTANVERLYTVLEQMGPDVSPDEWLPEFHKQRRSA